MRSLVSAVRRWARRRADPAAGQPDVAIVSYPKSGNTWVRFLVANLIAGDAGEGIDFHSVQKYVPEVGRHDDYIKRLPPPRIVKSHGYDIDTARKIIYIVRDGRDVYVSFYFHRRAHLASGTMFHQFLVSPDLARRPWGHHVSHWLDGRSAPPELLLVRYEDLLANCAHQLERIAGFAGLGVTREQRDAAVRASTFARMQQLEVERGRPYRSKVPDVFVRRGEAGSWREFFGPDEIALFKAREGDALIRLGYEHDESWGREVLE